MDKIPLKGGVFMLGIIFSIIAGISMSFQGVFNTRLSDKVGLWEANFLVQSIGAILTLIALLLLGDGNIKKIKEVNKLYLSGGLLGVIIIFTVMKGIKSLGPTYAISTILVAQLLSAALIDAFALFGSEQIRFGMSKVLGIVVMIVGIVIFKWEFK
ncbi:conserved membrane protein [Clostridium tetani E88]|uniref:Conserved membrane protein n=2 Tax=Clostridium tetani TaxID=1513 RepID=Q899N2_CLOTE|nr:conserved membrane protein [Clostridium tetani E88]